MRKCLIAGALSLAVIGFSLPAAAQDRLVRFEGGIGVVPSRVGGVATTARGVPPGGQPWVISRLSADVKADGRISVDGRGLLLGGGDNIGRNGGQSVRARLFCNGTAPTFADASVHQTDPVVPLEANGDFRIEDRLDPAVPAACNNAVLLIISAGGNWFAAGIEKF
jgi:hypothetical protein